MKASRTEEVLRNFHEEFAFGRAYDERLLRRLWPYLRPQRALLLWSVLVILVVAAGSLVRPLVMRFAIDQGVLARNLAVLTRGGLILSGVLVLEQVLGFVQVYLVQVAGARAMADLRRHVFGFLHERRLGFFDRQPVGRLVTRVTNDVDAILELFASGALNAIGDLVRLVGIVVMMLLLDAKLALIAFGSLPLVAVLVIVVRRKLRDAFREIRVKTARMNATMNEQVAGIDVVQAFGREAAAGREFDEINVAYREANLRSIKWDSMQDAAIDMLAAVALASIVMALGGLHHASFGTVVAFNVYLIQFFDPIGMLAQRYTLLQSAMAGAERVFALLDTNDEDAPRLPAAAPAGNAEIAFEHVSFAYVPTTPVLHDVSFAVQRGEKLALVGPTGSGKTTVASLLLRLYDLEQGVVRLRGHDVREFERAELRRRFAVVPQDVFLFPGTVASNVAAGETPDLERVRRALSRIDALDLFEGRKGGLLAPVDEGGQNFSVGERQLIAFARALYREAEVLILDEATASVDSHTEARLHRALEELLRDRTALVIAHRLSTIRAADRILVLHHGHVVEQGRHDELLRAGGLYARLHELSQVRGDV